MGLVIIPVIEMVMPMVVVVVMEVALNMGATIATVLGNRKQWDPGLS